MREYLETIYNIITNKKIILGVIVALVIIGAVVAKNSFQQKFPQEIKLGLIMPLTSPFGAVAEGVRNASLLAVADWETAHPGVHVATVVEDDEYKPVKGVAAYHKLKDLDNVAGIISISTPTLDALAATYRQDGLPVINLGVQTEGVAKDNIFQIFPDAQGQIRPLADHLERNTAYDSVALVHASNDPAYTQFYGAFVKDYTKPHQDFVLNVKDDARTVAIKIGAAKPKAVVVILNPTLGSAFTKELLALNLKDVAYYYDGSLVTGFDEYKKILGNTTALDGATTIKPATRDMSKFAAAYKAKYNIEPTIFAETGYDSTMVMLNAYNEDNRAWVEGIQNTSFEGPSGKTTFDENGVKIPEYVVAKVVGGEIK